MFPDVTARMRPSDFLTTFGHQLRFPSLAAYLFCWCFVLSRTARTPADVCPLEIDYRLSVPPIYLLRSDQDLPVYRVVPSMRAPVNHAARYAVTSPVTLALTTLLPSNKLTPSAPGI